MSWWRWTRRRRGPSTGASELLVESQVERGDVDDVIRELRAQVAQLRTVTARLESVAERTMGGLSGGE